MTLTIEKDGSRETVSEESFAHGEMTGFLPPLSRNITSLIYFADYAKGEFEPVLDERMIVYSYLALDPASLPPDYVSSEDYQVLLSRFLYVDMDGSGYRYEPRFVREQMERQMYRRWAHQGTWYGFTSYSNVTAASARSSSSPTRDRSTSIISQSPWSRCSASVLSRSDSTW